jgi:hypothetical protein
MSPFAIHLKKALTNFTEFSIFLSAVYLNISVTDDCMIFPARNFTTLKQVDLVYLPPQKFALLSTAGVHKSRAVCRYDQGIL